MRIGNYQEIINVVGMKAYGYLRLGESMNRKVQKPNLRYIASYDNISSIYMNDKFYTLKDFPYKLDERNWAWVCNTIRSIDV